MRSHSLKDAAHEEESFTLREECADFKYFVSVMCLNPRPSALLKPFIRAGCHGVSHLLGAVTWQDGPWEPSCPKIQAMAVDQDKVLP